MLYFCALYVRTHQVFSIQKRPGENPLLGNAYAAQRFEHWLCQELP